MPRKLLALVVTLCVLAAIGMCASAPRAEAASSTPFRCTSSANNTLLHPTWTVRCSNLGSRQYRARAWCQAYWAYGPWSSSGVSSKATCLFVFVDVPRSRYELR